MQQRQPALHARPKLRQKSGLPNPVPSHCSPASTTLFPHAGGTVEDVVDEEDEVLLELDDEVLLELVDVVVGGDGHPGSALGSITFQSAAVSFVALPPAPRPKATQ